MASLVELLDIVGVAVVPFTCIGRVQQMIRWNRAKSALNASLLTFYVEWVNFTVYSFYCFRHGHSLSAYAELPVLSILDAAIVAMILHFGVGDKDSLASPMKKVLYLFSAVSLVFWSAQTSLENLTQLWKIVTPIALLRLLPQILLIHQKKSVGLMSRPLFVISFLVTCVRIAITHVKGLGSFMLGCYFIQLVMVATVLLEFFIYPSTVESKEVKKKKSK